MASASWPLRATSGLLLSTLVVKNFFGGLAGWVGDSHAGVPDSLAEAVASDFVFPGDAGKRGVAGGRAGGAVETGAVVGPFFGDHAFAFVQEFDELHPEPLVPGADADIGRRLVAKPRTRRHTCGGDAGAPGVVQPQRHAACVEIPVASEPDARGPAARTEDHRLAPAFKGDGALFFLGFISKKGMPLIAGVPQPDIVMRLLRPAAVVNPQEGVHPGMDDQNSAVGGAVGPLAVLFGAVEGILDRSQQTWLRTSPAADVVRDVAVVRRPFPSAVG